MFNGSGTRAFFIRIMLIFWAIYSPGSLGAAEPPSANVIPQLIDDARGGIRGMEWKLRVISQGVNGIQEFKAFTKVRGYYSVSSVETPQHLRGAKIFTAKDKLWFWKPGQSLPVPVTRQQNLLGPISYGDIVGFDYTKNYKAKFIGEEEIEGKSAWVYLLEAITPIAPYQSLIYWLDQQDLLGLKTDFYSASGKKLRTARMKYENTIIVNGKAAPSISEIIFTNELVNHEIVTVFFIDPVVKDIPDNDFNLKIEP